MVFPAASDLQLSRHQRDRLDARLSEIRTRDRTSPGHEPPSSGTREHLLSERQLEIVKLMSDGCTNDEIAAQLNISPNTVRTHAAHIQQRLDARSRTNAVAIALRRGLIV